ncbi:hypothetical protein PR202_ga29704 [Eleusine coracana subsp. coracana]|uniref:X8 domain-containing protein n=1 Tax=Eleusine coracana subsp. coracana TaxID=191504 RepID=A0AAV5DM40_ELECO|nr:hypothetical protein PR202_ga29704 [Eleusine coracana subsp. coracana]
MWMEIATAVEGFTERINVQIAGTLNEIGVPTARKIKELVRGKCNGWEVGNDRLQAALDFACRHSADCSPIQRGGKCFKPNTKVAHASSALKSYYRRNHRAPGTCDFAGAGSVVFQAPSELFETFDHFSPKTSSVYGDCILATVSVLLFTAEIGKCLLPWKSWLKERTSISHENYADI